MFFTVLYTAIATGQASSCCNTSFPHCRQGRGNILLIYNFFGPCKLGSHIILISLITPYPVNLTVFDKILGMAHFRIVVETHRMAVCPGVMDHEDISFFYFGKRAVHSELVIVLAQRTGDIIDMIRFFIFLSGNGYMMIGTVQGGAHEICHRGIEADIILVLVRDMTHCAHKPAVRTCDAPPALPGR